MSKTDNKITLTIDGKKIETNWGKTILQVARENRYLFTYMCVLKVKVEPKSPLC